MIAAIEMQWLGVAVAALIVAVLLLVVLIRHRSADEKLMAGRPADEALGGPPPTPDALAAPRPSWAAPATRPPAPAPSFTATPPAPPTPLVEAPPAQALSQAPPSSAPAAPPVAATPAATPSAALVVTPEQTGSFLDEPLSRDFEALGKPSSPGPDASPAAPSPAAVAGSVATADEPASAAADHGPFPVDPFGSHEDIFPPEHEPPRETTATAPEVEAEAADDAAIASEVGAEAADDAAVASAAEPVPVVAAAPDEASPPEAVPQAGQPSSAPLSDILVTTGDAEVDLTDPAVRRLLGQLVDDEIELARQCRAQAQTLDAILQLTEAEKVCEALGLDDRLVEVRGLLAELQG